MIRGSRQKLGGTTSLRARRSPGAPWIIRIRLGSGQVGALSCCRRPDGRSPSGWAAEVDLGDRAYPRHEVAEGADCASRRRVAQPSCRPASGSRAPDVLHTRVAPAGVPSEPVVHRPRRLGTARPVTAGAQPSPLGDMPLQARDARRLDQNALPLFRTNGDEGLGREAGEALDGMIAVFAHPEDRVISPPDARAWRLPGQGRPPPRRSRRARRRCRARSVCETTDGTLTAVADVLNDERVPKARGSSR